MRSQKKKEFGRELILLTMSIYISAMLILGLTFTSISVTLFANKAREDMHFFLENIESQVELHIQFLEDIVMTMRHNESMKKFFEGGTYSRQEVAAQFSDCSNLFSERNLVNSQFPFVERIYIFNGEFAFESNGYYPITVYEKQKQDQEYNGLYADFLRQGKEYAYEVNGSVLNICFRVYDESMQYAGVCIASLNMDALQSIFQELDKYEDSRWLLYESGSSQPLARNQGRTIEEESYLTKTTKHAFGISSAVSVKEDVLYLSLKPTIITFLVIFTVLFMSISVVVLFVTNRFARPLGIIAEKIRSFGQGGFHTRLEEFNTQELNDISIVFNEMAERINELITQNYEKKLLASQAQVKFLQAQINPHFMFNIMSMIGMRAKLGGNDEITDLITAFSKLMQGKIFRKGEIKIPLKEEMELVGFYLFLQENRFRDKIAYSITYDSEEIKEYLIPRLSIEPFVENAVSHGLEQKEGKGFIKIELKIRDGKLFISVEDDGVGFDVENLQKFRRESDESHVHVGLSITDELIHVLYGEEFGIHIDSEIGRGTKVLIELPVEMGDEEYVEGNGGGR